MGCCSTKWPWPVLGGPFLSFLHKQTGTDIENSSMDGMDTMNKYTVLNTVTHGAAYKMVIEHVSKQELSRYSLRSAGLPQLVCPVHRLISPTNHLVYTVIMVFMYFRLITT